MYLDILNDFKPAALPERLSIKQVTDTAMLEVPPFHMPYWYLIASQEWAGINGPAFEMTKGIAYQAYEGTLTDPKWTLYIGYLLPEEELIAGKTAEIPVTANAVYYEDGIAGVYLVGTVEAHRGRGYAKALLSHLVLQAKIRGETHAALWATEYGFPVYRSIGFKQEATGISFVWRP